MMNSFLMHNNYRLGGSLSMAAIITLALLLLMTTLIKTDFELPAIIDTHPMEVIMPPSKIDTELKSLKPERPIDPEPLPNEKLEHKTVDERLVLTNIPYDSTLVFKPHIKNNNAQISGEYLPVYKVQPIYPRRALSRGIEGWAVVEFTVQTSGAVRDVLVIEAYPEGIFDQAAIKAARKFKYKPRIIDGAAIEVRGVRNKITFAIEK